MPKLSGRKRKRDTSADETRAKRHKDNTLVHVYVLINVMEYHGGTRGSQLGVYATQEDAQNAWEAYAKYQYDEEHDEQSKGIGSGKDVSQKDDSFWPESTREYKILKFKMGEIPTNTWPGEQMTSKLAPLTSTGVRFPNNIERLLFGAARE